MTLESITRAEAKRAGFNRYFTGKPCLHGHVSERYVYNGGCRKCWKIRRTIQRRSTLEKRVKENEAAKKRRKATPEHRRKFNALVYRWRMSTPERRIAHQLRSSLSHALSGRRKPTHTLELLGCTVELLISEFRRMMVGTSMTFEDRTSWHIDHIKPIASFNHSDPEQVRQCWHWTNLQPLPPEINMAKGCSN